MDPSLCVLSSFLAEAAYRSGVTAPLDIIARRWVVSPVHLVKPTPTTTQRQHACSVCRAPTLSKPAQSAQLVLLGMPISTTPRRQCVRRALRGRTRGRAGRSARSARWGGRPTPRARLSALCASLGGTLMKVLKNACSVGRRGMSRVGSRGICEFANVAREDIVGWSIQTCRCEQSVMFMHIVRVCSTHRDRNRLVWTLAQKWPGPETMPKNPFATSA